MYDGSTMASATNQDGRKKTLIIGIAVFIVLSLVAAVLIVIANSSYSDTATNTEEFPDAEQIKYDSKDESTGGEDVEIPNNETLNFLKQYMVADEDISSLEYEIRDTLDEYYFGSGYNSIIYDIDSVKFSETDKSISFSFKTDKSNKFIVSLVLLGNNHIDSIEINHE